jgi:hypothetical protein
MSALPKSKDIDDVFRHRGAEAVRGMIDAAEPVGAPLETINGKPALQLPGDDRPMGEFAAEIGTLLAGQNIFARKGCAFTLDAEGQKLEPATPTWLRTWAEQFVVCYKVRKMGDRAYRFDNTMTEDAAKAVLVAPQFLKKLRSVERFHPCRMPVIRHNGTVELLPEGYDAASATYTAPGSPYPLDKSAEEARQVFGDAFAEFPFAEDAGRSQAVAIAAVLTVYAGGIMPVGANRPVFIYLGNAEGTGKTTCARLAGICYGAVAAEAAPVEEGEWQKKILAVVIAGKRILLLDNLKGVLNSPSLEAYTTASRFAGRILGVSREFEGEACATVLITGNGLTTSPDMRRRALMVELFMDELRAEDRKFSRRLDDPALLALRPHLLAACWAMVKAWDNAGRPAASRMNSSFPRWCDTIGGIVEQAGFVCATAPAEIDGMGDTDTNDIARLGAKMVQGTRYTFSELAALCTDHGLFERFTTSRENDDQMSRSAKAGFPKILKRYDRRTIAQGVRFYIEGKGRDRRFCAKAK